MLKNYFLVAIRNLFKNKFFSLINITGLALGIATSLLMFNYLRFERSYDRFNVNSDRIYRVPMSITEKGQQPQTFAFTYPAVANAMKSEFPEVEHAVRLRKGFGLFKVADQYVPGLRSAWVDNDMADVFSLSFIYGDGNSALAELNNTVLTRTTAMKLFGEVDARGKTLTFFDQVFQVSAVIEDMPVNSHLQFDVLLPFKKYVEVLKTVGGDADNSWGWSDFYTYVLLKPGTIVKDLEQKLPAFTERHKGEDMKARGYDMSFYLQPLADIHTRSAYDYEFAGSGNYTYLDYIGAASLFILLMAWLNYVNLSTSRSLERAKEVGVRKSIGAYRLELIKQFLLESLVVNVIAVTVGLLLVWLTIPYVSNLIGKPIDLPPLTDYAFWGLVVTLLIVGALVSGFYPAFVLSGFKPFNALKGMANVAGMQGTLRKTMVVVQVSLAVILISGTVGLLRQIEYMRNQNLGVNINQTLVLRERVPRDSTFVPVINSFINELQQDANIKSVTASGDIPGQEIGGSSMYRRPETSNGKRCRQFEVDENFFLNYELPIIAGRGFSKDFTSDEHAVILNETGVSVLGFENAEDAINKQITDDEITYTVIGVVKDYHQESLQYDFNPTVFQLQSYYWNYYSLKVSGTDMTAMVAMAETTWKKFFPDSPFEYFFLDEYYNAQYKAELTFGTLLSSFTTLGIVVACLGLLGLSSFTVAKRTKEIGVRKILGASVTHIVGLITKEYLLLVGISFVIAIPLSQYLVNLWLLDYAFKVTLGWWFFLLPFVLTLLITFGTVGLQSLKAAWGNPVNSLRND